MGLTLRRSCSRLQMKSQTGGITAEVPGLLTKYVPEENRRAPRNLSAPSGPTSEIKQIKLAWERKEIPVVDSSSILDMISTVCTS